ncbi:MAG TPA: hypothetical protein PLF56_09850 [Micropruina sp.]|jgi:hypothetical protein|nr:hypothetical protein [Micropruina sp.]
MRTFVIAIAFGLALAIGLTAGVPLGRPSVPAASTGSSTHVIPWLCRIFGLCCER